MSSTLPVFAFTYIRKFLFSIFPFSSQQKISVLNSVCIIESFELSIFNLLFAIFIALLIEIIFTCTIAVIVTLTVRWVGLLIINSLLVLPAAAARNISKNVRQYHLFSVLIAIFSGITGLIISYYLNTVTGATIVLVSSVIFFITLIIRRKFV